MAITLKEKIFDKENCQGDVFKTFAEDERLSNLFFVIDRALTYYIIITQRSPLDLDKQQSVSVCTINFNEEKCKHEKPKRKDKDKVCIKFSLTEDECKSVT